MVAERLIVIVCMHVEQWCCVSLQFAPCRGLAVQCTVLLSVVCLIVQPVLSILGNAKLN